MQRLNGHGLGIDRGSLVLFSDVEEGGRMWTGTGERATRRQVRYGEAFAAPPVVQVSVSMWDMDAGTNQRGDIAATRITETGFTLVFKTWGDTRIARLRCDWLALGPLRDPELWELG